MKENIRYLIEKYTFEAEKMHADMEDDLAPAYTKGRLSAIKGIIEDLTALLEEDKDDNDRP